MNEQKLTPELEADLRAKINPVYVNVRGTESYERKAMLDEIDRLRHFVDANKMVKQSDAAAVAWIDGADQVVALIGHHKGGYVDIGRAIPSAWKTLYAAPPEVAALQARIAELKSEPEQLRMSWHNARIMPDGWKPVPIEPTENMIRAACLNQSMEEFSNYDEWWNSHSSGISERIRDYVANDYRIMISAAPTSDSEKS